MGKTNLFGAILVVFIGIDGYAAKAIYSSRLIHRLSDEAQAMSHKTTSWPERKTFGHVRLLLGIDLKRQRLRRFGFGAQNQTLLTSHTFNNGNDMGWLHYTWIDIGTPNNSFLVALDTGSDMFWVPCDCIECAPLPLSYYNILVRIPCSHELCEMGPNCKTPNGHCPYTVNYLSEDTSSLGFLFKDQLHLVSVGENKWGSSVQASIVIGCGSKQSGEYLDGIAPDGLMGLGPGDISIPSLLGKSGLIPHSFSFCYDKSFSGQLYFGDQGPASQRSTSLLPLKGNRAYIVQVETHCVGYSCLKQTGFKALVDTGSSFTYLTRESYEQVVFEFHRQANATRITTQGFENCYKARSLNVLNIPSLKLLFSMNQSFVIENPMFHIADDQGGTYCLGTQPIDEDIGIIGQNFLMGYRLVFDWENLKLGWSTSNCEDIDEGGQVHLTPPPSPPGDVDPLPTNEQQQKPHGHVVAPAVAGRATPKLSSASSLVAPYHYCLIGLPLFHWTAHLTHIILQSVYLL